jgi:hypothetical protein
MNAARVVSLSAHSQDAVPVNFLERFHVGTGGLEDPEAQ